MNSETENFNSDFTRWGEYRVSPCPCCGLRISSDEIDFCYPLKRDSSKWASGCPSCSASVEGSTKDYAILKWNIAAACFPKEFCKEMEIQDMIFTLENEKK